MAENGETMVQEKDIDKIIPTELKLAFNRFMMWNASMDGKTFNKDGIYPQYIRQFLNEQVRACAYGLKYLEKLEKEMNINGK